MKRTTLVSAVFALAGVLALASTAQAQADCPYDVVGTTVMSPSIQLLPDGWVTYDGSRDWWEDDTLGCYNAYLNAAYYSYFAACDFDGDGTVEFSEVYDIYLYGNDPSGFVIQCPVDNPGGTAAVESVSFGGSGYNTIRRDDSQGDFYAPHWSQGVAEPVAYVRGNTPAVSVTIRAESAAMLSGADVMIFGDGPGSLDIPATFADVSDDLASLDFAQIAGTLPSTVDLYEPFTINWKLSLDAGGTWIEAGTTENTLYVLYSWPMTTLYETTADIACRQAQGLTNEHDIVYAIWEDFTDLEVFRKSDGALLTYYPPGSNPQNMPATAAQVLSAGYGNCVGYGNFFKSITEGLGVPGVIYTDIRPYPSAQDNTPLLLAKNWNMDPYFDNPDTGIPRNEVEGIPGMGNPNPGSKLFVNHILVRYNGQILDTSYGIEFDTLLEWQQTILEAVMYDCSTASSGLCFDVNPNDSSWPLLVHYQ